MSWITKLPIAHRGLHNNVIPENSILSFEKAADKGYAIELDVHLSNDGKIVVFHDDNLQRMTGFDNIIETQSFSTITSLKLLNTDCNIPSLYDVLDVINSKVPLLIEIKNKFSVGHLEKALCKILDSYSGEYAIQSFNPYSVGWYAKNKPNIKRGQLSGDFKNEDLPFYKKFLLRYLFMNWYSKPDFIAYDIDLMPSLVTNIISRKKDIYLLAWTIDSQEKFDKAKKYADNIIFEGLLP